MHRTPHGVGTRFRLLTCSQSSKLAIVKSEMFHQILAYNHGAGFGEQQVFLRIARHAGRHDDHGKPELIVGQELAAGG